jgi:hypothetical protein
MVLLLLLGLPHLSRRKQYTNASALYTDVATIGKSSLLQGDASADRVENHLGHGRDDHALVAKQRMRTGAVLPFAACALVLGVGAAGQWPH